MRFLTNVYDPRKSDARQCIMCAEDETQGEAWRKQENWLRGKIIGKPQQANVPNAYTVEQLEEIGYVGIYEPETDAEMLQAYFPSGIPYNLDLSKFIKAQA